MNIKKVPIVLMGGNNDVLAPPTSVDWLVKRLPSDCLKDVYMTDRDHG
jgi:pimeloyl-ACP methyl ester carboxylesterase